MLTAQKKADHILEKPGPGFFCGYYFKNQHVCKVG